jgi:hypothetical protein
METSQVNEVPQIVLVNKPVSEIQQDLLGYTSQTNAIKKAIQNGANLIGVIADYGTGKSCLTDMICLDDKNYLAPIKINLWDCLENNTSANNNDSVSISPLIKSFLYQLALGNHKKGNIAHYVNKRLSKNYGILSLSITKKSFWVWVTFAVLIYTLASLAGTILPLIISNINASIIKFIEDNSLSIAIIVLICGLYRTNIAFSLWDSQGKREPELSDSYSTYSEIIESINKCCKNGRRQLIIIEDLDRIETGEIVFSFLKDIYKFNNLLSTELKKKIIYVISVKPESSLKYLKKGKENNYNQNIYSKIFDYTIYLNSVHNDDYQTVALSLLLPFESDIKKIIGREIEKNSLPDEFSWIIKGSGLTIRDIKSRLNYSFSLYNRLKSRGNGVELDIAFEKCAVVAYLQDKFPSELANLIRHENEFTEIIQQAQFKTYNNTKTLEEKRDYIAEIVGNSIKDLDDVFVNELTSLLLNKLISDDFTMYFYTYPKNGYILNTQEKLVKDIILSAEHIADAESEALIRSIYELNPELFTKTFDLLIKQKLGMPISILHSHALFQIGYSIYPQETLTYLFGSLRWEEHQLARSEAIIQFLSELKFMNLQKLIKSVIEGILPGISKLEKERILKVRKMFLENFQKSIPYLKNLFVSKSMPIIQDQELAFIEDIKIRYEFINVDLVSQQNSEYITRLLAEMECPSFKKKIISIIEKCLESNTSYSVAYNCIIILLKNNLINENIFKKVINYPYDLQNFIVDYLSSLNISDIPDSYYNIIDEKPITSGLPTDILQELFIRELYTSYLLCMFTRKSTNDVLLINANPSRMIESLKRIFNANKDAFICYRYLLIKNYYSNNNLRELFYSPYPLITLEELELFDDVKLSLSLIDTDQFDGSNIVILPNYANRKIRTPDDLYCFINYICEEGKMDSEQVQEIYKILDFNLLNYKQMSLDQQEECKQMFEEIFELSSPKNAIEFMSHTHCLLDSLEQVVKNEIKEDSEISDEYFKLISNLQSFSPLTLKICEENYFCIPLWEGIEEAFFENKDFISFLVSNILRTRKFNYSDYSSQIEISNYAAVYRDFESCREIMVLDKSFLQALVYSQEYKEFPKEILSPFYAVCQTTEFIKYVFSLMNNVEKKEYLTRMKQLNVETESKSFLSFILEPKNIELVRNNAELKEIIKHRLLTVGEKAKYSREVNTYYRQH